MIVMLSSHQFQRRIEMFFQSHLKSHKLASRQHGILYYHKDCDILNTLHTYISNCRQSLNNDKFSDSDNIDTKDFHSGHYDHHFNDFFSVAMKLNTDHIRKTAERVTKKYSASALSLSKINIDELLNDIDPALWNFFVLLTLSKTEARNIFTSGFSWDKHYLAFLDNKSSFEERRFIRHIFFNLHFVFQYL